VYVEDCDFVDLNAMYSGGAFDAGAGARVVFRHNTLHNQTANTESTAGRERGGRSLELYANTYQFDLSRSVSTLQTIGAGSAVVFDNTVTAFGGLGSIVAASNCRDSDSGCSSAPAYPPWGPCNGQSGFDQNSPGQTGYRCLDQPGAGTSVLLSGDAPTPAAWAQNASEPIYLWNNTVNGLPDNDAYGSLHVQAGRDYFTATPRPGYTPYQYPHPLVR
jgi:hypothetical protein